MRPGTRAAASCVLSCALAASPARADTLLLTNGRVIEADRAWYEGAEVRYERNGGVYGIPRSLVQRVDQKGVALAPEGAMLPSTSPPPRAEFRIRYEGGLNEALGMSVLNELKEAHAEFTRRLGFAPEQPISVVLQTGAPAVDSHLPDWAEGVNDGTIRIPVQGQDRVTPRLQRVLRHELAHSFLAARTGGNCPTWLQEGVSQWLEGGDPSREDAGLQAVVREGRLHPLLTLEAPFQALPPAEVSVAYAESLSAVAHILRTRGPAGVIRLISALGDRIPSDEALPVALGLSYPEFQSGWEAVLAPPPPTPAAQAAPRKPSPGPSS